MKKLLTSLWLSLACVGVIFLTCALIIVFYIAVAFRKLFIKDFTPNAFKEVDTDEDVAIGSAKAHLNAMQASLEKTEAQSK